MVAEDELLERGEELRVGAGLGDVGDVERAVPAPREDLRAGDLLHDAALQLRHALRGQEEPVAQRGGQAQLAAAVEDDGEMSGGGEGGLD